MNFGVSVGTMRTLSDFFLRCAGAIVRSFSRFQPTVFLIRAVYMDECEVPAMKVIGDSESLGDMDSHPDLNRWIYLQRLSTALYEEGCLEPVEWIKHLLQKGLVVTQISVSQVLMAIFAFQSSNFFFVSASSTHSICRQLAPTSACSWSFSTA